MKLFIWDFHGVLEKDNEKAVIDISNAVLSNAGYDVRFTQEDNERFYGLKWYEYFQRLMPKLSKEECLKLQADCFKYAEEHLEILAKHIKPNDHAIDVLKSITESGNQQIVISNTRQNDLLWFLSAVGIKRFFNDAHIVGVNAHQQHNTKSEALKAYLKTHLGFDQIIVIGDSGDDLKLGKEVGATTYYYKHPHREHENTYNADHIIKDLRQVLAELK
ncbi:MAG TPA: HAD hydrolase-like protein [Patescibacteria group bacterium]|nr:HAD hydrolase-like protein [Patescibacteria group bacterium]